MAEVLHVPDQVTAVRALRAPDAVLDDATRTVVDAAVAQAEARGRREGEEAGRRAAAEAMDRAVVALQTALDRLHQEMADHRELLTRASLELAATVAAAVLDRTPPDDAMTVLERVERAVALLDADPIEVRLHPDDHALLAASPTDRRLELVADPTVALGDARVGTAVAGAELTRRALLEAAVSAVGEGGA